MAVRGERLIASEIVDDPYAFYAALRNESPVWKVPGTDAYFVSTWDLVTEAAGRVEDFSNHFRHVLFSDDAGALGVMFQDGGGAPDVLAGADPPEHGAHRKLFFPELTLGKMSVLEPEVAALTDELLDSLLATTTSDAAAQFANSLPIRVVAERVVGFRDVDPVQLQGWVFAGSRFMGGRLRFDEMPRVGAEAAGIMPWVAGQLDCALAEEERGDVLSAAAHAVRDGALTHDEATFTLTVLVGAGGETTTALIGNAMRILAERADIQEELRADPTGISAFVEEVLRFESPFRFHPRTVQRTVELGGVTIPERAMVALLWGSANRDASVFDQPDEFVVGRPNAHLHVGFGRGIHHCVGAPLARLEARVALTRLLARTSHFALDDVNRPTWVDSLWTRRHERLPMVWA